MPLITNLVFVVNPCPPIPAINPPRLNLNVTCASHVNLTAFIAFAFPVTGSGPTDPSSGSSFSALVASTLLGSEYESLCNCLRQSGSVQITLQCIDVAGFLVVQHVFCQVLQSGLPVPALAEIRASTQRIEAAVSVTVINDLNLLKAQMAQVLARLPPVTGSGAMGPRQPISGFPQDTEDTEEDSDRNLFPIEGKAS